MTIGERDKELIAAQMDEAASAAETDLAALDAEAVRAVRNWWKRHYLQAGHKRLGRVLVREG